MSNYDDYDFDRQRRAPRRAPSNGRRPVRDDGYGYERSRRGSELDVDFYEEDDRYNFDYDLEDDVDMYDYRPSGGRRPAGGRPAGGRPAGARPSGGQPRRRPEGNPNRARSASSRGPAPRNSRDAGRRPAQQRPAPSRKGKPSKAAKKKKTRTTIIVVEVVLILVLLFGFFLWSKFGKVNWDNIKMEEISSNDLDEATEEVLSNYKTIALFGVDNRSNGNLDSGNSDAIILVSINNDTNDVKMLSVQRDTYLQVEKDVYRKCNYAYNHGGVEQALEMLNTNLDIKIDGYVSVDFYALAKIVDDLGGLDLEITQKMIDTNNPETGQNALAGYIAEVENVLNYYPKEKEGWKMSDCYFDKPGTYHLNGAQVVGFCRNRYAVNNDYGRAENQRMVVKLIVEKAKHANVSQLNDIADDVFPKISTSLSLSQCLGMAKDVGKYNMAESSGFPFSLKTKTISKKTGSVVVPCTLTSNVVKLHKFLYDQDDYDPTDDGVDVISEHIQSETGLSESSAEINQEVD
ncbi:transcriptional attenuator, LytR family [Pseudobutyrivibrio sp. YE44]|uniref:LCP family protein n=1 Tax=Pseudobutyrivibrio sp. YE44 TaxID=1520802 RepID=UPI000881213D|nr:LCP family protein [Pseudobutyrivibrio sp. YE44]SDB53292.1 transcriptional attenuator, LytR family [Pseudobutyrivibrio sp. YE44]